MQKKCLACGKELPKIPANKQYCGNQNLVGSCASLQRLKLSHKHNEAKRAKIAKGGYTNSAKGSAYC